MDILGLGPDYSVALLLLIAGAFAGFVDSIVGGGGLVSVPAFLLTNLPPAMALGTNKCSSLCQETATLRFCGLYAGDLLCHIPATPLCKTTLNHPTHRRYDLCVDQEIMG